MQHMGGVVKCKIVTVVRKTQNVLEGFEVQSFIRTSLILTKVFHIQTSACDVQAVQVVVEVSYIENP